MKTVVKRYDIYEDGFAVMDGSGVTNYLGNAERTFSDYYWTEQSVKYERIKNMDSPGHSIPPYPIYKLAMVLPL